MMECYILAGGKSLRFGEDKLLYRIKGLRTIEHVLKVARSVCSRVYILAKEKDKFKDIDAPVITDLKEEQAPIVGLLTALEKTREEKIMLLSGDMPLLKADLLRLLQEKFTPPSTLFSIDGKLYPTVAIYSKRLLPELKRYMDKGHRSLMGFLKRVGFYAIDESYVRDIDPQLESFINMNTKKELEEVLERLT